MDNRLELVYVGNDYYQTTERVVDDSPSGSDYWSCYIPSVILRKMGLAKPERGCACVLSLDILAPGDRMHNERESEVDSRGK